VFVHSVALLPPRAHSLTGPGNTTADCRLASLAGMMRLPCTFLEMRLAAGKGDSRAGGRKASPEETVLGASMPVDMFP